MSQVDTTWFHLRAQQASDCIPRQLHRAGEFHETTRQSSSFPGALSAGFAGPGRLGTRAWEREAPQGTAQPDLVEGQAKRSCSGPATRACATGKGCRAWIPKICPQEYPVLWMKVSRNICDSKKSMYLCIDMLCQILLKELGTSAPTEVLFSYLNGGIEPEM